MKNTETEPRCPYLEEVVMLCCNAYPIKKLVPRDRITTATRCFKGDFQDCLLYRELMARLESLVERGEISPGKCGEQPR